MNDSANLQWTLVTGGAKRLGAEISLQLARMRMPVLIHYYQSELEAKKIAAACREMESPAEIVQADFSSMTSLQELISQIHVRFPKIKNLINNVGNFFIKSGSQTSIKEWTALFQTNLHAPFALMQAFLASMVQYKGNVINMGVAGLNAVRGDAKRTAYTSSKMALLMLTKSMAKELALFGVRINMVSPGYLENAVDLPDDLHKLPMRRAAKLEEVVRVIMFLLSEENGYITGQNIEVGGGLNL